MPPGNYSANLYETTMEKSDKFVKISGICAIFFVALVLILDYITKN